MPEKWTKKWDGKSAEKRATDKRTAEEARRERRQAQRDKRREKRSVARERSREKTRRKRGVFDVVVPPDEHGVRRCPRCGQTEFTKDRLRAIEFQEPLPGAGPIGWAAMAAIGKAHMICDHCGAAYPLEWWTA